jgi:PAS domain S-box-containing protein
MGTVAVLHFEPTFNATLNVSVSPCVGDDGQMVGCVHVVRGFKQGQPRGDEASARALGDWSDEDFKAIVDTINDGVALVDVLTSSFMMANAKLCGMLGYTRDEMLTKTPRDLHRPADLPMVMKGFNEAASGRRKESRDVPMKRKDGSVFFADISNATLTLKGRGCLLAVMRDISRRKALEDSLTRKSGDLARRVHELDCLYMISEVLADQASTDASILQAVVDNMPLKGLARIGACARIGLEGMVRTSAGFKESAHFLREEILIGGHLAGAIEIFHKGGAVQALGIDHMVDAHRALRAVARMVGISFERRQASHSVRLNEARLAALNELNHMEHASELELAGFALERAIVLTSSRVGFIGTVDDTGETLTVTCLSESIMNVCGVGKYPMKFPIAGAGIWAEAIRSRAPFVCNDYAAPDVRKKGLPQNHIELERFVCVPVIEGGRVVGMAGLGNKEHPYVDADVRQLSLFMEGLWGHMASKKAQELLRQERDLLNDVTEHVNCGILLVDHRTRVLYANRVAQDWFGPMDDLLGRRCCELYSPTTPTDRCTALRVFDSKEAVKGDAFSTLIGDEARTLHVIASPLFDEHGRVRQVAQIIVDITERKEMEDGLGRSIAEKELLMREIHHRAKNSLLIVQSFLQLQARRVRDSEARDIFTESQNRIRALSLIHEQLFTSADLKRMDAAEYLMDLVAHICRTCEAGNGRVGLTIDVEPTTMDIDRVMPCGIIVSELISNAFKYAFPGERRGTVHVGLRLDGERFRLVVRDDGVGLPEGLDLEDPQTFGLQLVVNLTRQIRGTCSVWREAGTEFVITFADEAIA